MVVYRSCSRLVLIAPHSVERVIAENFRGWRGGGLRDLGKVVVLNCRRGNFLPGLTLCPSCRHKRWLCVKTLPRAQLLRLIQIWLFPGVATVLRHNGLVCGPRS